MPKGFAIAPSVPNPRYSELAGLGIAGDVWMTIRRANSPEGFARKR
jgi:hypothetical protein